MASVTFDQLIHLYRHTSFTRGADGQGSLEVADASVQETLKTLKSDANIYEEAGIAFRMPEELAIGTRISIVVQSPVTRIGLFFNDVGELLSADAHKLAEPARYYVASERFAYNDRVLPDAMTKYRAMLRLVGALSSAAALVDRSYAEAIFLGAGQIKVRFDYGSDELALVRSALVDELEGFVAEKIHRDQRLAILSSNVIELCKDVSYDKRFRHIVANLKDLIAKSQDAYTLFASEFSYDKIRGKTEESLNEYSGKIHKTFWDIQNQIIGVPVATVVVATQLKRVTECGAEVWGNLGVAVGATLFVILLAAAVYNQWMTLDAIQADLGRQKDKLKKEYVQVASQFNPVYDKLDRRVLKHRVILLGVVALCGVGLALTWFIFWHLTSILPTACLQPSK